MTYTKNDFAKDLKQKIKKGYDIQEISQWASLISIDKHEEITPEVYLVIQKVAVMHMGEEFEMSQDELISFANDLESNQ